MVVVVRRRWVLLFWGVGLGYIGGRLVHSLAELWLSAPTHARTLLMATPMILSISPSKTGMRE